jgi:LmbE family N-acetylglucosaminyl deacetylase
MLADCDACRPGNEWLAALRDLPARTAATPQVVIVAAHPDDEVIGAGSRLPLLRDSVYLVHVTDGSPRRLRDALAAGCSTREEYARLRRRELAEALDCAGIGGDRCLAVNLVDQEASWNLAPLAVRGVLADLRPEIVLSHPYEGGHPDHDAAAFATHLACRLLLRERGTAPFLAEFTSYHAGPDGMTAGQFLAPSDTEVTVALSGPERALKQRMIDCFATQREMLRRFPTDDERFRPAPPYDFSMPPHPGLLYYERFDWGMTGVRWRALARSAAEALKAGPCL